MVQPSGSFGSVPLSASFGTKITSGSFWPGTNGIVPSEVSPTSTGISWVSLLPLGKVISTGTSIFVPGVASFGAVMVMSPVFGSTVMFQPSGTL